MPNSENHEFIYNYRSFIYGGWINEVLLDQNMLYKVPRIQKTRWILRSVFLWMFNIIELSSSILTICAHFKMSRLWTQQLILMEISILISSLSLSLSLSLSYYQFIIMSEGFQFYWHFSKQIIKPFVVQNLCSRISFFIPINFFCFNYHIWARKACICCTGLYTKQAISSNWNIRLW
jgi:hypothetical protein